MKTMRMKLITVLVMLTTLASIGMGASAEEMEMTQVDITIGDKVFAAQFYANETAGAFLAQMPMTLDMTDINRNEKKFDLPQNLPHDGTVRPDTMHAGEIMLWSGNTIVLFYETFTNVYGGYVKLGHIEDATGLKEAVGARGVQVTFAIHEEIN